MNKISKIWRNRKMNNKLEVIGIDHGWSMMKTVTQVFVTGVKEITTTPALFGDVLEYDGKYYKIGTVISRKLNVIVYETQQSADSDGLAFKQSIAKSKQCYVLLRIMRKIVKGKGKCDRQVVDAEFVIELDGEESKLFKEMFAELLK